MKTKFKSFICAGWHSVGMVCAVAVVLQFGVLAGSAQPGIYLFSGSETTITLNPGTYDITAYGAQGGGGFNSSGGLGAEMEGQFSFATVTTLTLLVGGDGEAGGYVGGGGGGSFVVNGSRPLVVAGGGGGAGNGFNGYLGLVTTSGGSGGNGEYGGGGGYVGGSGGSGGYGGGGGGGGYSGNGMAGLGEAGGGGGGSFLGGGVQFYGGGGGGGYSGGGGGGYEGGGGGGGSIIDSSAIMVLAEVSGVASPDDSPNGEVIITAVPEPTSLALAGLSGLSLMLFRRQRK